MDSTAPHLPETPVGLSNAPAGYGSDVVAETIRSLGLPYLALNPGASFRGLHDSLVNHTGNRDPRMLLCLHEEHAVAIAHGWAKVTGTPMGAVVHSNVGLMHATMAVFNAWCDRVPLVLLGATGPVDAAKRRPWIDWIHTSRDQGALIRNYVKWDDQPASVAAAQEALVRARQVACTMPCGPVYVNLDAAMQEEALSAPLPALPVARYPAPEVPWPAPAALAAAAQALRGAKRGVMMVGRVSRDPVDWAARVALAETLSLRVISDMRVGAGFPTDHPLHAGAPGIFPGAEALAALREADLVLDLDGVDPAGAFKAAGVVPPLVIRASMDHAMHNGWSHDHQALAPADHLLVTAPDVAVRAMLEALSVPARPAPQPAPAAPVVPEGPLTTDGLSAVLRQETAGREVTLIRLPLGWNGGSWPLRHPLDYLGYDGGGGIGSGPGMAVGAALALRDSGSARLPVAVLGDGDTLMGLTALWTAARYRIPVLVIISNNQSFFNDEVHQEKVARQRGRPVENKWIGQAIRDPDPDFPTLARGLGLAGFGPASDPASLAAALREAIAVVESGLPAVVEARVVAGYTPAMASALTRES
ncbi:Acetolactate synthase large subunit [Roseomonas rosea]|uniref:Acetolactate synthase large subunit n=1 Tax=Muricoccus roseus TaxID=198092 RepID=A0A1M6HK16_9PROT|nr:thiamine pyrophosphate-dependent enzyme [Roseomonas rosea]SHJ22576.1 Acetolactate synthase large subunit [Roseomonas rosea]